MKNQKLNVHLYVTPECNLKCKHCYSANNKTPGDLLGITDMIYIINSICDHYDASFDVEGGEIFKRTDIGPLLAGIKPEHLKRITITTNGTIIPDIDVNYLKPLDEFRVSVEGHNDGLQKEIRGIPLKPVLDHCQQWRSLGVPVVLRLTLHQKNFRYLKEMIGYFYERQFVRFSLYEFQPVGRGNDNLEYILSAQEMNEIIGFLCSEITKYQLDYLKLSLPRRRGAIVHENRAKLNSYGYEIIDTSKVPSLTINYNGDLGFCPWAINDSKITRFNSQSFMKDVEQVIEHSRSFHDCDYCTSIRVRYEGK